MAKIIGIVGGIGPKAGESLHGKILSNTRAAGDLDHLPILLYTNPAIPDRTDFVLGKSSENPAHQILASLRVLVQAGAQVLCVPCNTAHAAMIWDVVTAGLGSLAAEAELLHIVNLTVDHVWRHRPKVSHVGILATTGTIASEVYQVALAERQMSPVVPSEDLQHQIHEAIYNPAWGIKAQSAPVSQHAANRLRSAANELIADGAEAIILGCTEIPLAFTESVIEGVALIDSTNVLARAAIQCAAGEQKLTTDQRSL